MTFERHTDQPFDIGAVELAEALAAMAGPVLELHRREDRWLFVKAGDSIRTFAGNFAPGGSAQAMGFA